MNFDIVDGNSALAIQSCLQNIHLPVAAVATQHGFILKNEFDPNDSGIIVKIQPYLPEYLGDNGFRTTYGTRYALYGGAMANGISSDKMVIAMGKAGMMASFGAGGLLPDQIEKAIHVIKDALPNGPYLFNLINSPGEPALEERTAQLYIEHNIHAIEASAYLGLTSNLVWSRASGLSRASNGDIVISHHVIAKISRKEIAKRFFEPASQEILNDLVTRGKITSEQAELARLSENTRQDLEKKVGEQLQALRERQLTLDQQAADQDATAARIESAERAFRRGQRTSPLCQTSCRL